LAALGSAVRADRQQLATIGLGATQHLANCPRPALDPLETPWRRQLRIFGEYLAPSRQRLIELYRQLAHATVAPEHTEALRKANQAIARAMREVDLAVPTHPPVQEDYSFRCFPQVVACAHRALDHVREVLAVEINAATDNPLLFPPPAPQPDMTSTAYRAWLEESDAQGNLTRAGNERVLACIHGVIGGGNFHGEPLAIGADYLAIAIAEVASIAERQIAHLVDEATSNGLPAFLIEGVGLNSGFMIPQYTAAALVSENKVLCHPASVDSIPTSANSEDHVSMGTHAARKCAQVVAHLQWVLAIEVLACQQAIPFRAPLQPGRATREILAWLASHGLHPSLDQDRVLAPVIAQVRELLRDGQFPA
jgi:histidine ammonia-lyase